MTWRGFSDIFLVVKCACTYAIRSPETRYFEKVAAYGWPGHGGSGRRVRRARGRRHINVSHSLYTSFVELRILRSRCYDWRSKRLRRQRYMRLSPVFLLVIVAHCAWQPEVLTLGIYTCTPESISSSTQAAIECVSAIFRYHPYSFNLSNDGQA